MLLVLCQSRHPVHTGEVRETGSWRQNASVALGDTQSQEKYIAEMEEKIQENIQVQHTQYFLFVT